MFYRFYFQWLPLLSGITCISIPFISNVILFPGYLSNFTIVNNRSIEQCLCLSLPSFVAFNWFPNNTCQLFVTFPITYKIQTAPQARLYFAQGLFPNASQCCMPDLGYLLNRLRNGISSSVNLPTSRNLVMDSNGYVIAIEANPAKLNRYDARNLSLISQTNLSMFSAMVVAFQKNNYYIGFDMGVILLIDSGNLSIVNYILSPFLQGIRSIMFLNQARTLVTTAAHNRTINFFDQTSTSPPSYAFAYQKAVRYPDVHGLNYITDSLFYATSWTQNRVYSYTSVANSFSWNETRVIDAGSIRYSAGGTFVTTDECGRHWFSLETSTVHIFDSGGTLLGNLSLPFGSIMDTLITDNYVMYFSGGNSSGSYIARIDPQIQC